MKTRVINTISKDSRKIILIVLSIILIIILEACVTLDVVEEADTYTSQNITTSEEEKETILEELKNIEIFKIGYLPLYMEAQPYILVSPGWIDTDKEFYIAGDFGEWKLVKQGDKSGFLPKWFIEEGKIKTLEYLKTDPMTLKDSSNGYLYPDGPVVSNIDARKLINPIARWNEWYYVSIIVYDIPAVMYAWVKKDMLAPVDEINPLEGYIYPGTEVYVTDKYEEIKNSTPQYIEHDIAAYVITEKEGYINIFAAGGWTAWTYKDNIKYLPFDREKLQIIAGIKKYSPMMSITPGIPLKPSTVVGILSKDEPVCNWYTEYGRFLFWGEDGKIIQKGNEMESGLETVYWSVDFEKSPESPEFKIYLKITDSNEKTVYGEASVTIKVEDDGFYTVDGPVENFILPEQGIEEKEFSIRTANSSISLLQWDNSFNPVSLFGKPLTEELIRLEQADTLTGSYIKKVRYEGIELELFSPKDNGKSFYVLNMRVKGNELATYRDIKVGNNLDKLLKQYPGINKVADGRTDENNCAYEYSDRERSLYLQFEIKEGIVKEIYIYYLLL